MPFQHLDAIVEAVDELASRFDAAGHSLYLVGGIVRDQWLDEPADASADIDLTTDAVPAVTRELITDLADALWTQGERFGTIGMNYRSYAVEITTHRAESYQSDSRKPTVAFGDSVEVDLSRRDFTVNAMAIRVPGAKLVDPWGGADDLAEGRLRTPLDPSISFADDPLRMMRAARFSAKYSLTPSVDLVDAAVELRERLRIVAIERIGDELRRTLALDQVAAGLSFLVKAGLAEVLLTWNTDAGLDTEVLDRLANAPEIVGKIDGAWTTRLAGFLLAVLESVDAVARTTAGLRLSRDAERSVNNATVAAFGALDAIGHGPVTKAALRRWGAGAADPDSALAIAVALDERATRFRSAWRELCAEEGLPRFEVLAGATIMSELGVKPGRVVGDAVKALHEAQFAQGPLGVDAQIEVLHEWWSQRDPNPTDPSDPTNSSGSSAAKW